MLSASEPCGEAVNEDDVESGSPFLCALNKYQSLTRPDRAIRFIIIEAMKRLLILPLAIMLVGYTTSSCSSSASKDNEQNDSIAAAELEAARLDSIRQDSIARRNFTSPDLAFNDLHGDVKKCEFNSDYYFIYDENGKWTNEPQWDESDKQICPDRTKHPRVIRDNDGFITRIYMECDADYEYEDISWEDGKVKTRFMSTYTYNDDGLVIDRSDEEEYDTKVSATYCNYEVDGMGNWVKRDVIFKILDTYQNALRYEKHTETRNITYHKSKGEGRTTIPNNATQNAIQELALKSYNQQQEQDDSKGPEWINGTWNIRMTIHNELLGAIKVNTYVYINRMTNRIKVVDSGEVIYNGTYVVEGNSIKYDRHANYCSSLDLNIKLKRIDFGDGNYMVKISNSPGI